MASGFNLHPAVIQCRANLFFAVETCDDMKEITLASQKNKKFTLGSLW